MTQKEYIFDLTKKILENKKVAISPMQIYKIATNEMNLKDEIHSIVGGKTPWQTIYSKIYIDLRDNTNSMFEVVNQKPKLIKLKNQIVKITDIKTQTHPKELKFNERDLHTLLSYFVRNNENFDAYSKTIFHEESCKSKKGVDKWLYPDMVGVSFGYKGYVDNILKFSEKFYQISPILYSFEIKKILSTGNLREYFFQAVSNSSWANYGYLVALDIDESDLDLIELVKKLNISFGIGVISLNSEDLNQSQVLANAKFNENIDISIMNDLCIKNRNFKDFIYAINSFDHKNSKFYEKNFDEIYEIEDLEKYMLDKKIK